MKSISLIILVSTSLITISCFGKRPKHKPKHQACQKVDTLQQEDEELEEIIEIRPTYHPNPVVLAGVGQIMNGALSIAQDPHNRPNIGHSVASMIHGIISIIIEKVAHKKIDISDKDTLMECCDEVCSDISKEITEIIIAKSLLIKEN